jgi:hypothetical protein
VPPHASDGCGLDYGQPANLDSISKELNSSGTICLAAGTRPLASWDDKRNTCLVVWCRRFGTRVRAGLQHAVCANRDLGIGRGGVVVQHFLNLGMQAISAFGNEFA